MLSFQQSIIDPGVYFVNDMPYSILKFLTCLADDQLLAAASITRSIKYRDILITLKTNSSYAVMWVSELLSSSLLEAAFRTAVVWLYLIRLYPYSSMSFWYHFAFFRSIVFLTAWMLVLRSDTYSCHQDLLGLVQPQVDVRDSIAAEFDCYRTFS